MTIGELRAALDKIGPEDNRVEVQVWLPGSTIYLGKHLFMNKGKWMVEGNVTPGSALDG